MEMPTLKRTDHEDSTSYKNYNRDSSNNSVPMKPSTADEDKFEIPSHITIELLEENFTLPLSEAALSLGLSMTKLKKICRKFNIKRWPHRQVRSLDNEIEELDLKKRRPNITCAKTAKMNRRIELLKKKKVLVIKAASCGLEPKERNKIFGATPKQIEDVSFATSEPRPGLKRPISPHEVMSVVERHSLIADRKLTQTEDTSNENLAFLQECLSNTKDFYQNSTVIPSPQIQPVYNPYEEKPHFLPYHGSNFQNEDNLILDGNRDMFAYSNGRAALIYTDGGPSIINNPFCVISNSDEINVSKSTSQSAEEPRKKKAQLNWQPGDVDDVGTNEALGFDQVIEDMFQNGEAPRQDDNFPPTQINNPAPSSQPHSFNFFDFKPLF
eukprot:CAMPEP_0117749250 /NCGR_PEP_ID=MMETSP0947-20121206/9620_1 /TAXON_ID=44440 /ORGANISM="Chattonella subsalsa, Strain CCMP2191" /LENGTH=382 /DNA_ID=CAMNT_0005567109 /DNA_START=181 /DNA_END=1329 /DNA_ORIENTATION=-